MKTVTTRVDTDTHEQIEDRAEEADASKSAIARDLIKQGLQAEKIRRERDRLREQLSATNHRIDATNELVEYVEEERSLRESRRNLRKHNVFKRAWWWLAGEPSENNADEP